MSGFWTSEAMKIRLPQLITPYREDRVQNCSYELSLGGEVFVTGEDKTKRYVDPGSQIVIPPGQFANLLTEELVRVPDTALGLISMKFTLKQSGLVNVSGFHVDPGYVGHLLFSVYNAGPQTVVIARGDPAFLLWYSSLEGPTKDVYDKPPRMSISSRDVDRLHGDIATPQALADRVDRVERRLSWRTAALQILLAAGVGSALTLMTEGLFGDDGAEPRGTTTTAPVSSTSSTTS